MSFSHGDSVIINGLKDPNYQSYNGQNGVIGEYFEDSKRYTVTVRLVAKSHSQEAIKLKLRLKNLKPALATPDYSYSQNHIQIANVDFIDDACDDEGIGDIHNPKWRVFMPKSRRRWRVYQEKEMNDLLDRCEIQQPKVMNGTDGVEYTIVKSSDNEGIIHYTEDLPIKKLSVCPDNQNEYKRQQQEQEPDEKSESADDESIQQWQWFDKENRRWCVSPDISEDMSKLGVSKYCGGLMKTSEDTGTLYREATSITYKLRRVDPLNTRYPDSFEREYTAQKTLHLYRNKSIMK
eukprot:226518_1